MVNRDDRSPDLETATWPFPASAGVVFVFWFLVVALALVYWVFA
jgi:hypothetical protein